MNLSANSWVSVQREVTLVRGVIEYAASSSVNWWTCLQHSPNSWHRKIFGF